MTALSLSIVLFLALITVFVGKAAWLERLLPQFRWISLAAGVSLAYVFLELLPELSAAQRELEHSAGLVFPKQAYLLALAGIGLFYALEVLALASRSANLSRGGADYTGTLFFGVHILFFAAYNFLIGDLLNGISSRGSLAALLLGLVLALHFYMSDEGLSRHHSHRYHTWGRWVLAAALLAGYVIGERIAADARPVLWALVTGALILNTVKEEMPKDKESCLISFFSGAGIISLLILSLSSQH
ncbi:MAG: hypothetical protein LC641_14105 [Spirochaeta sp.]|nr:hypothetical protein [Spirochaeta sp.]